MQVGGGRRGPLQGSDATLEAVMLEDVEEAREARKRVKLRRQHVEFIFSFLISILRRLSPVQPIVEVRFRERARRSP